MSHVFKCAVLRNKMNVVQKYSAGRDCAATTRIFIIKSFPNDTCDTFYVFPVNNYVGR